MKPQRSSKDIAQIFRDRVLIDEAMRLAFEDAIEDHRRTGVPMVFWKDGKIVHMTAEEVIEYRKHHANGNGQPKSE